MGPAYIVQVLERRQPIQDIRVYMILHNRQTLVDWHPRGGSLRPYRFLDPSIADSVEASLIILQLLCFNNARPLSPAASFCVGGHCLVLISALRTADAHHSTSF